MSIFVRYQMAVARKDADARRHNLPVNCTTNDIKRAKWKAVYDDLQKQINDVDRKQRTLVRMQQNVAKPKKNNAQSARQPQTQQQQQYQHAPQYQQPQQYQQQRQPNRQVRKKQEPEYMEDYEYEEPSRPIRKRIKRPAPQENLFQSLTDNM